MAAKHWIAVGGLLIATTGFVLLGRWQLERAEVNRAIEQRFPDAEHLPVLTEPVAADRIDTQRYRLIELEGHYRPDMQILLDNMTLEGKPGYEVLTPFEIDTGQPWVLVNRGWIAASLDRSVLPDVSLSAGPSTVTGRIDRLPRAALRLDAPPPDPGSVMVMSFPDTRAIEAALQHDVQSFQLLLDPSADEGLIRDWAPEAGRADRNIAYAVQWFGLATLAFVCAAGVAWRARRGSARSIGA